MFENVKWLFFDVGSTLVDEHISYEHRMRDIAKLADISYERILKPDKRIFEIAFERSNCKPSNAIMIGDRVDNDIVPANLLGMHTIWIKQGFGQYQKGVEEQLNIKINLMFGRLERMKIHVVKWS